MSIFEEKERHQERVSKKTLGIITTCELLYYSFWMFPLVSSLIDTTGSSLNMYTMWNGSDGIFLKTLKSCMMDWNSGDLEFIP